MTFSASTATAPIAPSTWNHRSSSPAQIGDRVQIIHRASVDSARAPDHTDRTVARGTVGCDGLFQCIQIDGEIIVDRDFSQMTVAQSQQFDRLLIAAMHLRGCIDGQWLRSGLHPDLADVEACLCISCNRQTDEVGHRAAADQ